MARAGFPPPPPDAGGDAPAALRRHGRALALALLQAQRGRINVVLDVELTAGTSTVLADARLSAQGWGAFDPLSAPAAADLAGGGVFVAEAGRRNGEWTVTHPAGPAGRRYRLAVLG